MFFWYHQGVQQAAVQQLGLQKIPGLPGRLWGKIDDLIQRCAGDSAQHQLQAGGLDRFPSGWHGLWLALDLPEMVLQFRILLL